MSPPTRFGFDAWRSAVVRTDRAVTMSRNPGAKRSICASIAAVASNADPAGTWQYAHNVWTPFGARVESHTVGCETSTNGRDAARPPVTSFSLDAISPIEPPRWSVPARRASSAVHGTGALSA